MRPGESLWFSEKAYDQKIHEKNYTFGDLARNIYTKPRAIASSTVSAATGIACAHVSGGASLLGSAFAGRNINVEHRKLAALERFWEGTGAGPLHHHHVRDNIIPIVIATAIGAFAFNIDLSISNTVASSAYAAQLDVGYSLPISGHALGGVYWGVESGMRWMGNKVNEALVGDSPYDAIAVQELHYQG